MTITNTTAWDALPLDSRVMFYDIASKEGSTMTGAEWFYHLVPNQIQDQPDMVEVYMNGGTVTREVYVHDQGRAGGHYEQVEYNIADKDVSRIQSGANGGEYTTENTIMEDASANRARGGDNMTAEELESIETSNALEAELLNDAEVLTEAATESGDTIAVATSAAEAGDGLLDVVLDGVLPVTYGAKAAQAVWNTTEEMETGERIAVTALGGGGVVLGTYTALSLVPGLNLVLGGIALYKAGTAIHKMATHKNGQALGNFLS